MENFYSIIFIKISIVASLFALIGSLIHIFGNTKIITILNINTSIPFISINFTLDKLSAFFIFCLSILVLCVSIYSIGYNSHYYNKRNVGLFNFLFSTFIISMIFVLLA